MVPAEYPDVELKQRRKNPNTLYKRVSANEAGFQLQCLECKETLPIKNQPALEDEISRLRSLSNEMVKPAGCRDEECSNHGIPITAGKEFYSKFGANKAGNPRYKCKACNKTFAINTKPHTYHKKSHLNAMLFTLLVNKAPTSRIVEITRLSPGTVYEKVDFIYKQCVLFSKYKEDNLQRVLSGKILNISSDAQHHNFQPPARGACLISAFFYAYLFYIRRGMDNIATPTW